MFQNTQENEKPKAGRKKLQNVYKRQNTDSTLPTE